MQAKEKRAMMIEKLADVDEPIGEKFLLEQEPSVEELVAGLRRATIANVFVPVMMGSAYKNKGVQLLLDRVHDLLPCPTEVSNTALDVDKEETEIVIPCDRYSVCLLYWYKSTISDAGGARHAARGRLWRLRLSCRRRSLGSSPTSASTPES